jgi:two-component system LytT family sensor kinase
MLNGVMGTSCRRCVWGWTGRAKGRAGRDGCWRQHIFMVMRSRYWVTVTLAGFAAYTVIAVLGSISTILYFNRAGVTFDATAFVANRFLEQYTCAMFVPFFFWLIERRPLTTTRWRSGVAVYVGVMLASVLVKYAVMLPLYRLWVGDWGIGYWFNVLDNFVPVSFDFTAIIGLAYALRYHREVTERERAAGELRTQLVQARLDALRGQLHPHFLFNTLNAIATLMHEDVDAADRMLTHLGDLLRLSLERGSAEITLGEELGFVERYLAIMQHRFSDRLTVRYETGEAVANALVPTFVTQPLVENALEHGIARRRGPGRVEIAARRENGVLELSVSDDGPGVTAAPSTGIGLSNTRARLHQLYGAASTLTLEAVDGGGTRAVVRIPYRECAAS